MRLLRPGIDHIVYTSFAGPVAESPIGFAQDHEGTEKLITESGADHSILRNNMYTDFLLMGGQQSVAMGTHFSAAADGKTGYVTRAGDGQPGRGRGDLVRNCG